MSADIIFQKILTHYQKNNPNTLRTEWNALMINFMYKRQVQSNPVGKLAQFTC